VSKCLHVTYSDDSGILFQEACKFLSSRDFLWELGLLGILRTKETQRIDASKSLLVLCKYYFLISSVLILSKKAYIFTRKLVFCLLGGRFNTFAGLFLA